MEDKLKKISENIQKRREYVETEEATKNAFILPFLEALGYDIFDPMEVVPEFKADIGTKRREKVDYAIMKDSNPIMIIECKSCAADLDNLHISQLYRYFSVTPVRFGMLTNGIVYKFYTDIEKSNIMDNKPFLEIDLSKIKETDIKELTKFAKHAFNVDDILSSASDLKYMGEMKKIMIRELAEPSDEFVHFLAKKVYSKPITERARLKFRGITEMAMKQVIKDQVNAKLKSALEVSDDKYEDEESKLIVESKNVIVTTEEELEGYYIIKSLLHEVVDTDRVTLKDTVSYCGIILDNNNRKPVCRLHFNSKNKRISLFDNNRKEEKISIENLKDIYNYYDRIKATIKLYDT